MLWGICDPPPFALQATSSSSSVSNQHTLESHERTITKKDNTHSSRDGSNTCRRLFLSVQNLDFHDVASRAHATTTSCSCSCSCSSSSSSSSFPSFPSASTSSSFPPPPPPHAPPPYPTPPHPPPYTATIIFVRSIDPCGGMQEGSLIGMAGGKSRPSAASAIAQPANPRGSARTGTPECIYTCTAQPVNSTKTTDCTVNALFRIWNILA